MCPIADGESVNATNSNRAWLDAENDDTAKGIISLENDDPDSDDYIVNTQRALNIAASNIGGETDVYATGVTYSAPASTIVDNESHRDSLIKLANKFDPTTGHAHAGGVGDGSPVAAISIASVRLRGYWQQGTNLSAVSGTSTDVSTEMSGKTASSGSTVKGVVVLAPYNKTFIQDENGDDIKDAYGNIVFGRITESTGTWTLSYYVDLAGVETAYDFTTPTDIKWFFQQIYNPITDAPVYDEAAYIPSENATADIIQATATEYGKVLLSNAAAPAIASAGTIGTQNGTVANADHTHEGADRSLSNLDVNSTGVIDMLFSTATWDFQIGTNTLAEFKFTDHYTDSIYTSPYRALVGQEFATRYFLTTVETSTNSINTSRMYLQTGHVAAGVSADSGALVISSGYNLGTGATGFVRVESGQQGVSGNSGPVTVGSGFVTIGNSGNVSGQSGKVWDTGTSGYFQFRTGDVVNSGTSGYLNLFTGDSLNGTSGTINIRTGLNSDGQRATIWLESTTGIQYSTTSVAGSVNSNGHTFTTGDVVDGVSGDFSVTTGAVSGTGTRGKINLNGDYVDCNSSAIKNVEDPTDPQDAATKNYVDTTTGFGTPIQEIPAGDIDESNVTYTLSETPLVDAIVLLFLDGLILVQGTDYTIAGDTITMTTAPMLGQSLYAFYTY